MAPAPTRIRHQVVGVATLMAVLLYLDRNCLAFAAPYLQQDLGIGDVELGWVISAFYLSYALAQVPAGWLTDRFGSRRMLTLYVLTWSLFMGLTGVAVGLVSVLLYRLGMGLGQAGAYPTGASMISKWVPFSNRGFASALVSFGGRIGGSLAPLLTGYLIVAFTPTSVSSRLEPGDLLDVPGLCDRLAPPWNAQASASSAERATRRIAERLFALLGDQRRWVEAVAADYRAWRASPLAGAPSETAADPMATVTLPAAEVDAFRQRLNSILRERDAFSYMNLEGLSLEREAVRLLDRPATALAPAQVERLNRLILEAAFPGAIRRVYVAGWRPVMFAYGLLGAAVAGACWWVARDRPAEHPRVNEAELDLIRYGRPKEATSADRPARGLPLSNILASRSLWLSCLSQCTTNFGWMFLVAWLPTYLERVHKVPVEVRAWLVLIPFTVGWAGMLLGGRLTDWLAAVVGLRWGRALPMGLTRFVAMGAYLVCLWDPPTWVAVVAFSVVAFATDLGTSAVWAFCQDVGGSHVGSILGWGNMWGNLGAVLTPPVLIWLVGESYSWDRAFLACAAAFFVSGVAALAIDATVPIATET